MCIKPMLFSFNPVTKSHLKGFTLIELLVALSIFTVLSAMAYQGLNTVMQAQVRMEQQAENMAKLQTAMLILERDIEQVIGRQVRDEYGDPLGPFIAADFADNKLQFTRAGWNNPFPSKNRVRSYLQRVAYGLEEKKLTRAYWFDLDRGYESPVFKTILLEGVESFDIRVVDEKLEWQTQWPVLGGSAAALPLAVEVSIDLEHMGKITRLFRVPTSV